MQLIWQLQLRECSMCLLSSRPLLKLVWRVLQTNSRAVATDGGLVWEARFYHIFVLIYFDLCCPSSFMRTVAPWALHSISQRAVRPIQYCLQLNCMFTDTQSSIGKNTWTICVWLFEGLYWCVLNRLNAVVLLVSRKYYQNIYSSRK